MSDSSCSSKTVLKSEAGSASASAAAAEFWESSAKSSAEKLVPGATSSPSPSSSGSSSSVSSSSASSSGSANKSASFCILPPVSELPDSSAFPNTSDKDGIEPAADTFSAGSVEKLFSSE